MSQMKFVSSSENCVKDMLNGLSRIYDKNFTVDCDEKLIFYKQADNKVKILSGGGSGHEPFCAGFIGSGMLSAAVAGDVFASPPSRTIFHAINTLALNNDNNGILVIIMNYTGDILNFGLAIERAKFHNIQIESIIVDEDCSRSNDENIIVRRRGMSGGVFVMKIAGAMASGGSNLTEIKKTCDNVIAKLGSIGTCVTSCTVPGVGTLFQLPAEEMEFGVGVHGEAGAFRCKLLPVKQLVSLMLGRILEFLQIQANQPNKICVLINNLGAVSQLELAVIANEVYTFFDDATEIDVCRLYVGSFMTSLDMAGFQICLLNVTNNPEWIAYLDQETNAPAWPKPVAFIPIDRQIKIPIKHELSVAASDQNENFEVGIRLSETTADIFKTCLKTCAEILIQNKDRLNELDKAVGDGDTGTTLSNLCSNVLGNLDSFRVEHPETCFLKLSEIAQIKMGGTSGALYSLAFTAAAEYFKKTSELHWHCVYESMIRSLTKYSTAKLCDRTMLDVLLPIYEEYKNLLQSDYNEKKAFVKAVSKAREKLKETCYMTPKVGRASYVSRDLVKSEDSGAYAITLILEGISSSLRTDGELL